MHHTDLSQRKTTYEGRGDNPPTGSCPATITKEEADGYVYERMMPGNDGWNPRAMMNKLPAPTQVKQQGAKLTWKVVTGAVGYIVFDGEKVIGFTKEAAFTSPEVKENLKVCAVNQYGVF